MKSLVHLPLWVMVAVLLSACQKRAIKVTASNTSYAGIVTQSVRFVDNHETTQWVCYTEIQAQVITGISCQNDTALPLFSGGLVDGEFHYDYPSKWLLEVSPERVMSYLKLALYQDLAYDQQAVILHKENGLTEIQDLSNHITVRVETL